MPKCLNLALCLVIILLKKRLFGHCKNPFCQYVRILIVSFPGPFRSSPLVTMEPKCGLLEAAAEASYLDWTSGPQLSFSLLNTKEICHSHLHQNGCKNHQTSYLMPALKRSLRSPASKNMNSLTQKKRNTRLESSAKSTRELWTLNLCQKLQLLLAPWLSVFHVLSHKWRLSSQTDFLNSNKEL